MSRIAFLFPGQGAQKVGMGRDLAESLPAAKELFEQADEILGYSLSKLCFEGPQEELDTTNRSQPALFVTSLAALESLRNQQPDVVLACEGAAGLSLGEYTAIVFAGVLDFEAGLKLVQARGDAMQEAAEKTPSGMVSILGLEKGQVEDLCQQARQEGETLEIANMLCPGNIVISGSNAACERAADLADKAGAKPIPLPVAGAFHTQVMRPADERLAAALENTTMNEAKIPVYSNVDAKPHTDPEEIRQLLIKQILQPVRWEDSIRLMLEDGYTDFHEVGPGRVLRGLLRRVNRKISCQCVMD